MWALPLVLLLVVIALAAKRLSSARAARAELSEPGRSPETAIVVPSFREVDARASRERCAPCEVFLRQTGEGSREVEGKKLRVVRLGCSRCDLERELFFVVDQSVRPLGGEGDSSSATP